MSLKGYEFLSEDRKRVVARLFFKDLSLYIYEEITDERLQEIKDYITQSKDRIATIIKVYEKESEDNGRFKNE